MIDVVGAIVLTVLAVATVTGFIVASPLDRVATLRLATASGVWFLVVTGLAGAGAFSAESAAGPRAIGAAVLAPIAVVAGTGALRSGGIRTVFLGIPLAVLVAVHVGRLLGAFFIVLHAEGRLAPTFALGAGWGDIAIALLAVPVAWAVHRRIPGWVPLAFAWNVAGFVDLVSAVALGLGSGTRSPIRFIFESPGSDVMGTLPWMIIPGVLVPLYLLAHLAIFARLARGEAR